MSFPEPLADRLYVETKAFLEAHVQGLLDIVRSKGEPNLLQAYHTCWVEYSQGIIYLHRLYLYVIYSTGMDHLLGLLLSWTSSPCMITDT